MADVITGTTTGFVNNIPDNTYNAVSDVRREGAEHTNEIVKESLKGDYATQKIISDSAFALTAQMFEVARDGQDNRAQINALGYQVRDGFLALTKDTELNALKTQIELSKQTTYLSDKIDAQAEATRGLINDLKYQDLNRHLIERNAELVEERHHGRHWRGNFDQAQWAAVNNQLQAFQSQLQETRQGMVNFGTMAGVGQTSTSNAVR
jgi:hypothetical protein